MTCKIIKNQNGSPIGVADSNGNPSKIFKQISQIPFLRNFDEAVNTYTYLKGKIPSLDEVAQQLQKTRLAKGVNILSPQQIEQELVKRGVDAKLAKQVSKTGGYYSNSNTAFSNLKDKNVKNVQGWMKALTDVQKNGGIKNVNQELEWIGLEDYLNNYVKENNPKAGNIPSSVVEDYIKSNQIEIVDVSKGVRTLNNDIFDIKFDGGQFIVTRNGEYEIAFENEDTANDYIAMTEINDESSQVRYSGYQLKGGENYREVLLTMPSKEGKNPLHTKRDRLSKQYREAFDSGNYDLANEIDNQISDITKQLKAENSLNTTGEKAQYKSSHWDEANILAHVRLNEKTLPDGRRVLILNEIQADISQDLKKEQDKILDRVDKGFDNFLDNLIMNKVVIEEC